MTIKILRSFPIACGLIGLTFDADLSVYPLTIRPQAPGLSAYIL